MQGKHDFRDLKIFEEERLNEVCDELVHYVKNTLHEDLYICGSVAKLFSGTLPLDYQPKDIDFEISHWGFRLLKNRLTEQPHVLMIEKRPHRLVFFVEGGRYVEVFEENPFFSNYTRALYQNKILYKKI